MQVSRAKSPAMKRIAIVCFTLLSGLHVTAAAAKSITRTHLQDQELTFDVPKKLGDLPPIEFDYFPSSKVTRFWFRDGNLLLIAMDEAVETRVRAVLSAPLNNAKGVYSGQIVTDAGGNQLMLANGPVTRKVNR